MRARIALIALVCIGGLGCSPNDLASPASEPMESVDRRLRPTLPTPVPQPIHPDGLRPSPQTFLELLAKATVIAPHLTKLPLDPSGNNDYVHPDIIRSANGGTCGEEIIVTPYKDSNAAVENPTIFCNSGNENWFAPVGIPSPLVPSPGLPKINSDPDFFLDSTTHETVITWREVDADSNIIRSMTTTDGIKYIPRGIVFKEKNHNAVSPTSVLEANRSLLSTWYVQAGSDGCYASESHVALREAVPEPGKSVTQVAWKFKRTVSISQPGRVIWHIDVAPGQEKSYLMLDAAYSKGSDCGHNDLFLSVSSNRTDWESFPVPFIWRTMVNVKTLYRGSLLYDPKTDLLDVIFSAMNLYGHWDGKWEAQYRLSLLLQALRAATPSDMPVISASMIGIDIPHEAEKRPFIAP